MTDERQALFEQIEKRADSDFVRELLAFAAERLMTVEVDALTGAAHGERTPERVNHRNGYRERAWETRAGRDRSEDPQTAPGLLFSEHSGAAPDRREGTDRRHPRSLHPRHLDPVRR